MQVNIELPDDVSQALQRSWGDLPRYALEALAAEGYRCGVLTEARVRRMLGFETRTEVHAFLKTSGVYLNIRVDDLTEDLASHQKLGILPPA